MASVRPGQPRHDRYVCVHGHFYQPPRENAWLEAIEQEDSAYPFHDWNERITAECYGPNAASRILDDRGRISRIVNNYSRISFNFGPTLLSWMETKAPKVYARILEADRESRSRFGGHGSAIAQVSNHMILPLANRRDKETQVVWGIADFERRFGRMPEGMWLAETAVDVESLEVLAANGIKYTILEPGQGQGPIDPTRAYVTRLPSGRELAIFFYDGPASRAVAFERLLSSGDHFANRLFGLFNAGRRWPQLVNIATDGETYGHHHRHGDMALAWALDRIERSEEVKLTNYGEYLELHPPEVEVRIVERTSWSCAHGVDRWRRGCGCASGMHPGWQQDWRQPLREALDALRDRLAALFEEKGRTFLRDPWRARDAYVHVILDRSSGNVDAFLQGHASHPLSPDEQVQALMLLEMQRHAMLMFTSCGWFFDEISGLEAVQVLRYAARAIQLAERVFGVALEPELLERLGAARSNEPDLGDGRAVYEQCVRPAIVDLSKVAAHWAVSSLFEEYGDVEQIFGYRIERLDARIERSGRAQVGVGRVRVTSEITREQVEVAFGALHFGDHNLVAGVRDHADDPAGREAYRIMVDEVSSAFARADLPQALRALDKHFIELTYSLRSLFKDEQRKLIEHILGSTLAEATQVYEHLYSLHAPLMRFLKDLKQPLPRAFRGAAELVLDGKLRRALHVETPDAEEVRSLLERARELDVELDAEGLGYTLARTLERQLLDLQAAPDDLGLLCRLERTAALARQVPFEVPLDAVQEGYHALRDHHFPPIRARAEAGDEAARGYAHAFVALGESLRIAVD